MLSHENNELLVRVSRGTPMGDLMRRYWHPVATSQQLPGPDGSPFRTKLLGERYVLFRNTDGVVGMLDEFCMHRGASLALGRVEGNTIQCLYHGWRFDVDGAVVETPNNADPRYKARMKAPAYPVVEYGGVIWAYVGPPELKPQFRRFAAYEVPERQRFTMRVNVKCNYLALWEGGLDSSHVSVLHTNQARRSWAAERGSALVDSAKWRSMDDPTPVFEVEDTAFGYHHTQDDRLVDRILAVCGHIRGGRLIVVRHFPYDKVDFGSANNAPGRKYRWRNPHVAHFRRTVPIRRQLSDGSIVISERRIFNFKNRGRIVH